jgi:nucleoside-diphosphate-sugar epimerase
LNDLKDVIRDCAAVISLWPHEPFGIAGEPLYTIYPHVEHTVLLFKACAALGIKRVLLAGSVTSITGGKKAKSYNEDNWADVNNINIDDKAKLYAERMAWYLINHEKDKYDINLTVLNLGVLLGPTITHHYHFASAAFMKKIFNGKMKHNLHIKIPVIDVRDAAVAFCKCLETDRADGKRLIISQGEYWMNDLMKPLCEEFNSFKYRLPTQVLGKFPAFFMSFIDEEIKAIYPFIGLNYTLDKTNSTKALRVKYREMDETLVEMVYNLIDNDYIKNKLDTRVKTGKKNGPSGNTSMRNSNRGTGQPSFLGGFGTMLRGGDKSLKTAGAGLEKPLFPMGRGNSTGEIGVIANINGNPKPAEYQPGSELENARPGLPSTPNESGSMKKLIEADRNRNENHAGTVSDIIVQSNIKDLKDQEE